MNIHEVRKLEAQVEALYKRGIEIAHKRRAGLVDDGLFRDTGIGAEYQVAYDAWMNARAQTGDRFALSLASSSIAQAPPHSE